MEKASTLIDDFYNDDVIVNQSIPTAQKEKIDFYADQPIKAPTSISKKMDSRIGKIFGRNKVIYTSEEKPKPDLNNSNFKPRKPFSKPLSKKQKAMKSYLKDKDTIYAQTPDVIDQINRYKILLENTSVKKVMSNNETQPTPSTTSQNQLSWFKRATTSTNLIPNTTQNKKTIGNNFVPKTPKLKEISPDQANENKNLLKNTSINDIMKNNGKISMWTNAKLNNTKDDQALYKPTGFFGKLKKLFSFKKIPNK